MASFHFRCLFGQLSLLLWSAPDALALYGRTDYVTLRYFGRGHDRESEEFPTSVCASSAPAICVDLYVKQCTPTPAGLLAPYTHELNNGSASNVTEDVGESSGEYMAVSIGNPFVNGTGYNLTLWSGCNENCDNCARALGGYVYNVLQPSMCEVTGEGGVWSVQYHQNGFVDPFLEFEDSDLVPAWDSNNSVCSNNATDDLLEAPQPRPTFDFEKMMIYAAMMLLGVTCGSIASFLFISICVKRPASHASNAMQPVAIGKPELERAVPIITGIEDEPTCVVCLVPVQADEKACKLTCEHTFHADCVMQWWMHKQQLVLECPLCKQVEHVLLGKPTRGPKEPATYDIADATTLVDALIELDATQEESSPSERHADMPESIEV